MQLYKNYAKREKQSAKGGNAIDTLIEAMQKLTLHNNEPSNNKAITEEQTENLFSQLMQNKDKKGKSTYQIVKSLVNFEESTNSSDRQTEEEVDDQRSNNKGKLTSGKCTKPVESDIKKVVKFQHEKLDSQHAKDRTFDKLPFNLLVAREIELIIRPGINENEIRARLAILKTIAYHKNYLQDEDLRDGYDEMMKKVEHAHQQWDKVLGEHLHEFLNFRMNLQARERMQTTENN